MIEKELVTLAVYSTSKFNENRCLYAFSLLSMKTVTAYVAEIGPSLKCRD